MMTTGASRAACDDVQGRMSWRSSVTLSRPTENSRLSTRFTSLLGKTEQRAPLGLETLCAQAAEARFSPTTPAAAFRCQLLTTALGRGAGGTVVVSEQVRRQEEFLPQQHPAAARQLIPSHQRMNGVTSSARIRLRSYECCDNASTLGSGRS